MTHILILAVLALSACGAPAIDAHSLNESRANMAGRELVEPLREQSKLCMAPCLGPHYNFSNGKIEFFSMGPGLLF